MPLDPKVQRMLEEVEKLRLPPLHTLPVAQARERAIAMRNPVAVPAKIGRVENRTIPGPGGPLAIRIYTPQGTGPFPVLVYFHGGGYVLCNLDTHDLICHELCSRAGCIVVSVDYRLAPEHRFPAAPDDCLAATRWAAANAAGFGGDASRIAVGGDSCGGNLATVTAIRIRDEGGPALRGQLMLCPITDHCDPPTPSYVKNAEGYFLTRDGMAWFLDQYLRGKGDNGHPHFAVLRHPDLGRLPPAFIVTAEYDPLLDEAARYAEKLQAGGVDTVYRFVPGVIHGFYNQIGILDQSDLVLVEVAEWLKRVLGGRVAPRADQ